MVFVLCGLEKRPDLNGHVVIIVAGRLGDERVDVKLAESGKVISVESYVFYTQCSQTFRRISNVSTPRTIFNFSAIRQRYTLK